MQVCQDFPLHHSFFFVATNMVRHQEALTLGNVFVFVKHSTDGLTMAELKVPVEGGDDRLMKKLIHFGSPIPKTQPEPQGRSGAVLPQVYPHDQR